MLKRPGRKPDLYPPLIADVKSVFSYTDNVSRVFMPLRLIKHSDSRIVFYTTLNSPTEEFVHELKTGLDQERRKLNQIGPNPKFRDRI